jgi:hypothetical protein
MHCTAARRAFPPMHCLQRAVAASLGRYAAPGKHVVSAAPQPAASTSALKRLAPVPPPFLLQRHKGFIYASAHLHDVDDPLQTFRVIRDGCTPVGIDAGFEVAPGEQSDFEVANAHGWGSLHLVFSDGTEAWSALRITLQFPNPKDSRGSGSTNPNPITIMISKRDPDNLKVDSEQRVRSMYDDRDVLLRKRA